MRAIVLFAHGSRDPLWRQPLEAVAQRMREQQPRTQVETAYLELGEPGLPVTVARLVASGIRHITVLPMFFGMGKHAREDLPALLDALGREHPSVAFVALPAVGEHPAVIEVLASLPFR